MAWKAFAGGYMRLGFSGICLALALAWPSGGGVLSRKVLRTIHQNIAVSTAANIVAALLAG